MSDRLKYGVLLLAAFAVVMGLAAPALAQEAEEDPAEIPQTEEQKAAEQKLSLIHI